MSELTREEKAKRLLTAIFKDTAEDEQDDYPNTTSEKVGYSEMIVTGSLQGLSRAIMRLSRLHRLLTVTEKDGQNTLPDIITHNETRIALEALLPVENDIREVVDMLKEIYSSTKTKEEGKDK